MIRDQIILQKNYNSIGLKCFACKQNNHIALHCSYLHYIPDKNRIIKMYAFNPEQKERTGFHRKTEKSMNALAYKIPIKLSYLKFKEFLKEYYIMEEDFMSGDSEGSLDNISEKEIQELEKYKSMSVMNFEENKLYSKNNIQSLNIEKPLISITRIKEFDESPKEFGDNFKISEDYEEDMKINEVNKESEQEINIIPEISEDKISDKFKKDKVDMKISRNPSKLSIDTNLSKSKNIMNRFKKRSLSFHKENEEDKSSLNSHSIKSYSKPSQKDKILSTSNFNQKEGSMLFNFEGLDLEQFKSNPQRIKKTNTQSISFGSLTLIHKDSLNSKKPLIDSIKNIENDGIIKYKFDSKNNFPTSKLGKQKSMMEPIKEQHQLFKKPTLDRLKSNESEKNGILQQRLPKNKEPSTLTTNQRTMIIDTPPEKSASLKKFKPVDEIDFIKSPLLKLPVYGSHSKFLAEKRKESEAAEPESKKNELDEGDKFNEKKEIPFEIVRNFKCYYPQNNVREIIQKIIDYKRKKAQKRNMRRKTRKLNNFNFEKSAEKISIDSNKVVPLIESSLLNDLYSARFSSPKLKDRRASNIFIDRLNSISFFKKATMKFTFYDVVFEVLHNKELRKSLQVMREKSFKKKIKSQLTNNN